MNIEDLALEVMIHQLLSGHTLEEARRLAALHRDQRTSEWLDVLERTRAGRDLLDALASSRC